MRCFRARLLRLERHDAEFTAELESHVQMHVEDNLRNGMTLGEARRDALLKLGGLEQTKESYREHRSLPWLEAFSQDLRYTLRTLQRDRAFALIAVVILALGIGANTAIFSVIHRVLLRPLPYEEADRLVMCGNRTRIEGVTLSPVASSGLFSPVRLKLSDSKAAMWVSGLDLRPEFREFHNFHAIARLKAGVSLLQAQAEMDTIASRIEQQYPESKGWGVALVRLHDQVVETTRPALLVLLCAVRLIL